MALHFVATSILESSDGLDFTKETALDSEEARAAKRARENSEVKPLHVQLAEIAAKKQEEYDANTKLMHAPPKGLDEEDIAFFEDLEASKKQALSARQHRDEAALRAFRMAQHKVVRDRAKSSEDRTALYQQQQQTQESAGAAARDIDPQHQPPVAAGVWAVIKPKRKIDSTKEGLSEVSSGSSELTGVTFCSTKKAKTDLQMSCIVPHSAAVVAVPPATASGTTGSSNDCAACSSVLGSLLAAYDSDED